MRRWPGMQPLAPSSEGGALGRSSRRSGGKRRPDKDAGLDGLGEGPGHGAGGDLSAEVVLHAKHVGADSYAPDASMATRQAKQIVGARGPDSAALEKAVMLIDETLKKG